MSASPSPTTPGSGQESTIAGCETGADANANDDCRLAAASLALDQFWTEAVDGYREPTLVIVDGSTGTARRPRRRTTSRP